MSDLIFGLLMLFVVANVYVEARNPTMKWWSNPLSAYLYGVRDAWVQSAAYLLFALAEVLLIFNQPYGRWWTITMAIAAAGLVGVVATANLRGVWDVPLRRRLHVACAGLAFGAALVAEFIALHGTPSVWLPILAAGVAVAFARFAPDAHTLEEKLFTLVLVAGFVPIVGIPL